MNRYATIMTCAGVAVLALSLTSCAKNGAAPAASAPAAGATRVKSMDGTFDGDVYGTVTPGGKFSRIRIGMPMKQVTDLIGQPTDTGGHVTGKAFIPFFFGGDTHRAEAYYKGEGHLTFSPSAFASTSMVLIAIHADRTETGYSR